MSRVRTLALRLRMPEAMLWFFLAMAAMTLLSIAYTFVTTYVLKA